MEEAFETTLSGTDGDIDGIVSHLIHPASGNGYEFNSLDGTLQIQIVKDEHGKWFRIGGTEPFLSGWVDELSDKITLRNTYPDNITF